MNRRVSPYAIQRQTLMAVASGQLLEVMGRFSDSSGLTVLEWLKVLHDLETRLIRDGLREEWDLEVLREYQEMQRDEQQLS